MASYQNVTSSTVQLSDLGQSVAPGATLSITDAQAYESYSLAQALEQNTLAMTDGGSWPFRGAKKATTSTIISAMTALAATSGTSTPIWTGVYEEARVYVALASGDLTWQYQSSPDGGASWFNHVELTPVQATTALNSVALHDLGVYGRVQWATVSGATFAVRIALKS